MIVKRVPTEEDLANVVAFIKQHSAVSDVEATPIVQVYTVIDNDDKRNEIYDLEIKVMEQFDHLRFDFRVTTPLTTEEKDTLKRGGFSL
jgi:hypothetical protein